MYTIVKHAYLTPTSGSEVRTYTCVYMLLSLGSFLKGGVAARLVLQGCERPGVRVAFPG